MLVRTPAMKLGVEVRKVETKDNRLVMSGVASSMPCTIEMSGKELVSLAGHLLRPSVLGLVFKSLFRNGN
jgi:hypothetical protein